jgi:starch synthase
MTIPRAPSDAPPEPLLEAPRVTPRRSAPPPLQLGSSPDGPVGVVHVVAEYAPYARTGGLSEAVAGLATIQASAGVPTTVIVPLHRSVHRVARELIPVGRPFPVEVGPRIEWARLFRLPAAPRAPRVFFIEHEGYFNRPGPYGHGGQDYSDNGFRFAFFAQAALTAVPRLCNAPVVVHAHDWHAALVPVYLRTRFAGHPFYDRVRTVLSIHNAAYQGWFPEGLLHVIGLPAWLYDWRFLEWYGRVNFLKGGIAFADIVTTVSPTHARELVTPDGGFGLHQAFAALGDRLLGIINGLDMDLWDPAVDPNLSANYSANDLSGKRRCKAALQRTFGLPQRYSTPLIGMAARLVSQKGLDLLIDNPDLFANGAQYVFTGRGDARYEAALIAAAARSHQRVSVRLGFSDRMARRIMSGADIFLVPSLYEPCGLTQMSAQRYGSLPVGRRVGGLADSIEDGQTGFLFDAYTPRALADVVQLALDTYASPARWAWLVEHAIERDFGWTGPAMAYAAAYRRVLAAAAVSA